MIYIQNQVTRHILYGLLFGYFILHPVTMVIYPIDSIHIHNTLTEGIIDVISVSISSFKPILNRMSIYFTLFGSLMGLVSGTYLKKKGSKDQLIEKQESELNRNILDIINKGESSKLEFKSSVRWDELTGKVNKDLEKASIKTLAGFMNNSGGILVMGVGDDGGICGIEKDYLTLKHRNRDGYEQFLMQLTSAHLGADLCNKIRVLFHTVEGKDICQVRVEPSDRPVYIENGRETHFFLRTGNTTHELNIKEAIRYITSNWGAANQGY